MTTRYLLVTEPDKLAKGHHRILEVFESSALGTALQQYDLCLENEPRRAFAIVAQIQRGRSFSYSFAEIHRPAKVPA